MILNRFNMEFHKIVKGQERRKKKGGGVELIGAGGDFGRARFPIRWGESDTPEIRGGLDELQANFRSTIGHGVGTDHAAKLLFIGLGGFQLDDLPGLH